MDGRILAVIALILVAVAIISVILSMNDQRSKQQTARIAEWMDNTAEKLRTYDRRILTLERKMRSKDNPYNTSAKEETDMTIDRMNDIQKWTEHLDMKTLDTADQLAMAQATTEYFEKINPFYEKYAKVREERVR